MATSQPTGSITTPLPAVKLNMPRFVIVTLPLRVRTAFCHARARARRTTHHEHAAIAHAL